MSEVEADATPPGPASGAQESSQASELKGFQAVSLLTLVSRIAGLARDSMMASLFGFSGFILDAFTVAFRVPNMFRRLFGEGAMSTAFLPEFARTDAEQGRERANLLLAGTVWRLFRILAAITLVIELTVGAVYLSATISPRSQLLCELFLILFPYMLLICLTSLYSAALHSVKRFVIPALAPVALNLIWLTGGLITGWCLSSKTDEARFISLFIVGGGAIQLIMVIINAHRCGIRIPSIRSAMSEGSDERVERVFRRMAPVLLGLSITQLNGLVDSCLAWMLMSGNLDAYPQLSSFRLPQGTAGALYLGQRLFSFPMGVFAVALGTVLFPRFAQYVQARDNKGLSRTVIHGLQLVLVVGVPASAGLWLMSEPVTDLLFRYHRFDATASRLTADMIAAYGMGVWIYSGLLIVNRVFFAADDQQTPMRLGLVCVGLNLLFDVALLPVFGGPALPIASMLATLFQLALTIQVLRRRFLKTGRRAFLPIVIRVAVGTVLMCLTVSFTLQITQGMESKLNTVAFRLLHTGVPIASAIGIYAICLNLSGLSPVRLLREPFLPAGRNDVSSPESDS